MNDLTHKLAEALREAMKHNWIAENALGNHAPEYLRSEYELLLDEYDAAKGASEPPCEFTALDEATYGNEKAEQELRALRAALAAKDTRWKDADGNLYSDDEVIHQDIDTPGPQFLGWITRASYREGNGCIDKWVRVKPVAAKGEDGCTADDAKQAARYRWWRERADWIAEDGGGVRGCAFACQIPMADLERKTTGELMDMIADHHLPPTQPTEQKDG